MKTRIYIDGFNLYYRCLKGTPHKWLNISALCKTVLPKTHNIDRINYYTARVKGKPDPDAPARQHAYLRALQTLPDLYIHYGKFLVSEKWMPLVQPPDFRPAYTPQGGAKLDVAYVYRTEEKGSDVNMGVHLVRDAALQKMDAAAIITNDTDLCEAVRIATQEFGMPVILLTPSSRPTRDLERLCTSVRHVKPYVGPCQFPDPMTDKKGRPLRKPFGW